MLDHLFGSKTRVALLKLFIENPEKPYFVRELTREIDAQINSVRRELENLLELGIVRVLEEPPVIEMKEWEEEVPAGLNKKKYYQLNKLFILHEELSGLFSKSHLLLEKDLMNQLGQLAGVDLLIMTGFFTNVQEALTDILLVGNVPKQQVSLMLSQYESKLGKEINYTAMTRKEFEYRRDITDKFLYDILMHTKIVLIDKIGLQEIPGAGR